VTKRTSESILEQQQRLTPEGFAKVVLERRAEGALLLAEAIATGQTREARSLRGNLQKFNALIAKYGLDGCADKAERQSIYRRATRGT
jgi:hypothetical protein